MDKNDVKHDIEKGIEKLTLLRDEVRVRLHLATMDAKTEWDEKLEPRVAELERTARHMTDASKSAVHELVEKVEEFVARLRDVARPKEGT